MLFLWGFLNQSFDCGMLRVDVPLALYNISGLFSFLWSPDYLRLKDFSRELLSGGVIGEEMIRLNDLEKSVRGFDIRAQKSRNHSN